MAGGERERRESLPKHLLSPLFAWLEGKGRGGRVCPSTCSHHYLHGWRGKGEEGEFAQALALTTICMAGGERERRESLPKHLLSPLFAWLRGKGEEGEFAQALALTTICMAEGKGRGGRVCPSTCSHHYLHGWRGKGEEGEFAQALALTTICMAGGKRERRESLPKHLLSPLFAWLEGKGRGGRVFPSTCSHHYLHGWRGKGEESTHHPHNAYGKIFHVHNMINKRHQP